MGGWWWDKLVIFHQLRTFDNLTKTMPPKQKKFGGRNTTPMEIQRKLGLQDKELYFDLLDDSKWTLISIDEIAGANQR